MHSETFDTLENARIAQEKIAKVKSYYRFLGIKLRFLKKLFDLLGICWYMMHVNQFFGTLERLTIVAFGDYELCG